MTVEAEQGEQGAAEQVVQGAAGADAVDAQSLIASLNC